ncbi:hypothetical protein T10_4356 [Trichinella papuae]|uniref:Uncharacterized protein n=1 Tax=Trichinella papuae TaxID=268474 RepID=A0A0V1MB03_9BILA|nr:hypothetical protein T10_4356 [Trichinella papuae]
MRLSRLCGKEHESRNAIATTTTITDCQTHSQLALKTSLEKRQVALKVSLGGANDKIFLTKQVSRSLYACHHASACFGAHYAYLNF